MGWLHLFFVLVAALLLLRRLERSLIYRPAKGGDDPPEHHFVEPVAFLAEDGCRLHGWWIPAEKAPGTLLVCHGNAGNLQTREEFVAQLRRFGYNLFLFDYRGYGLSRGRPSEKGLQRDARAAYEVVRARHGDAEDPPIVLYGISLGGAVAIQLASERPVRGLIVQCGFTSIADMSRRLYPWLPVHALIRDRYDSLARMPGLRVPVLVTHAEDDLMIPFEMGQALYEAASEPRRFMAYTGGHAERIGLENAGVRTAMEDFITACLSPAGDRSVDPLDARSDGA